MLLELNLNCRVVVSNQLNARLEQGDDSAFAELERTLSICSATRGMFGNRQIQDVTILDAGPHNVNMTATLKDHNR